MQYHRFEDLPVWQTAIEIADRAFRLTNDKSFDFQGDLRSQLGKAGLSIANNIAEGFERRTNDDMLRFLYYSRGSNGELRSMLYVIARNERYAHLASERQALFDLCDSVARQLKGLIASLERKRTPKHAPVPSPFRD
jgi:four helix bundle protein